MGMNRVRTIDMRGKQRLAAQVQAHHLEVRLAAE
jgi:hypothetical protein